MLWWHKPAVSIASTLKKRTYQLGTQDSLNAASVCIDSNSESDSERGSTPKSKMKKKNIIEKNIEKLLTIRTEESKRREETRQKRHIEHIATGSCH